MTLTATHHRFPTHGTTLGTFETFTDEHWTLQLSEVGSGTITVPLDDPNDVHINDLIRFRIDGTTVGAFIVEEIQEHTLDDDEDHAETRVLSGRGVGAVTDWVIVGPANGFGAMPKETERLRGAYAPDFDISGLDNAVLTTNPSIPAEWPDITGWTGPYISTTSATPTSTPAGPSLLFDDFTTADDAQVTLFGSADNWASWYIDGQPWLTAGGPDQDHSYKRTFTASNFLTAGTHRVAVRMFNKGSDNHGGIRHIIGTTSADGSLATTLHQSSDSWKNIETPSPWPGMTPGKATLLPLEEAQYRGRLSWLGVDYDESTDSNSVSWPVEGDISTRTGNTLCAFLMELSATYIDWLVDPETLTLRLFVKDTYAQIGGAAVSLTPAAVTALDGNVVQLDRTIT